MGKALVILSGGQDSTTCLYWALARYSEVRALTIDYGQWHKIELEAAYKIAQLAGVAHEVVAVGQLLVGASPLVNLDQSVGTYGGADQLPSGVDPTFVPGRNLLFLVLAANRAVAHNIWDVVMGVCEEDYGGYPDCREVFITQMARSLGLGLCGDPDAFHIHTPLMHLTKAQTVQLAASLPACFRALAWSHTCYQGHCPPCGCCHACLLRARGFDQAGLLDPLLVRVNQGG